MNRKLNFEKRPKQPNMKLKPQSNLGYRLRAFIIDFAIIYGLAFIVYNLLQLISIYISIVHLTLAVAMLYFPLITALYKASFGKIICGLNVNGIGRRNYILAIILREVAFKQLLFILPIYILVNRLKLQWLSPFIEILSVFLLSFLFIIPFLFTKKTWYDFFAKTVVVKSTSYNKKMARQIVLLMVCVIGVVFGIRGVFYFSSNTFNTPFIPKHTKQTTKAYTDFLEKQADAKDYIFELFEKNDIVILGEGSHPEMVQYDFIFELVSDKRFIENIGHVFSEVGSIFQQPTLDSLMATDNLNENELNTKLVNLLRDYSHYPVWENTNYYTYLKRLYALNQTLPEALKVKHYFSDLECNWDEIRNKQDYSLQIKSKFTSREKTLAGNIIRNFELIQNAQEKRKKCLVIMNTRHAFGAKVDNAIGDNGKSCASHIMKRFPKKTANVLMNTVKIEFGLSLPDLPPYIMPIQFAPIHEGIWDEAFKATNNKAVGFNFNDSPFGSDSFDLFFIPMLKKFNYQDIFTGFVFYKPLEQHYFSFGYKNLMANDFDEEILDRATRIEDDALDNNLKFWIHKVNQLKEQEVRVDDKPYQQFASVFELIFGTVLLMLGLWISMVRFKKKQKI